MIAKLGLSELSTSSYSMLDDITKGKYCSNGQRRDCNDPTSNSISCKGRISKASL